jgi:hypothetical protein
VAIWGFISSLLGPVSKIVDDLHTSAEEKLLIKAELARIQTEFASKSLDYEGKLFEARAAIIGKEATSESGLTRMWRPITMLTFLGIVVWFVVGKAADWPLPDEAFVNNVFGLIKLGLGGYVIGRSAEKVVPTVIAALKKKESI